MAGSSGDSIGKDIAEIKKLKQIKREANDELNKIKPLIVELEEEKKELEKKIHKKYRTIDEVESGLK